MSTYRLFIQGGCSCITHLPDDSIPYLQSSLWAQSVPPHPEMYRSLQVAQSIEGFEQDWSSLLNITYVEMSYVLAHST